MALEDLSMRIKKFYLHQSFLEKFQVQS